MSIVNAVVADLSVTGGEPSIEATRGLIATKGYKSLEEVVPSRVTGEQAYTIRSMRTQLIKDMGGKLTPSQSIVMIRFKDTSDGNDTLVMYVKDDNVAE